jgi:DNA-binding CsgD family transcriptional regulator
MDTYVNEDGVVMSARERIKQLHAASLTAKEMADSLDISLPRVYQLLSKLGLKPNATRTQPGNRRLQIESLHSKGYTAQEIASSLDVSVPYVYNALQALSLSPISYSKQDLRDRIRELEEQVAALEAKLATYETEPTGE